MSGLNNGNMARLGVVAGQREPGHPNIGDFALMNGTGQGQEVLRVEAVLPLHPPGRGAGGRHQHERERVRLGLPAHRRRARSTIVLANTATSAQTVTVGGPGLPAKLHDLPHVGQRQLRGRVGTTPRAPAHAARAVDRDAAGGGTPLATIDGAAPGFDPASYGAGSVMSVASIGMPVLPKI